MMNGRHLPAGQGMQYDGNRRRPYNQQHYQPASPMYNGYMNPYANYQPQPHYQHQMPSPYGTMPANPYPPYHTYGRSPPPQFQQYAPPPVVSSYQRSQQSPAVVSSPYQPPPPTTQRPSSTHSSSTILVSAEPSTPKTPPAGMEAPTPPAVPSIKPPFLAPLPWLSRPDLDWPSRSARSRKKRKVPQVTEDAVELPSIQSAQSVAAAEPVESVNTTVPRSDTPSTAQAPSEDATSTTPTTPTSLQQSTAPQTIPTAPTVSKGPRPTAAVPVIPIISKQTSRPSSATVPDPKTVEEPVISTTAETVPQISGDEGSQENEEVKVTSPTVAGPPKSWANLFKGAAPSPSSSTEGPRAETSQSSTTGGFSKTNNESLAGALNSFNATTRDTKLAFLKPRGLVNTGNMCYMNSVLQVLVFCVPFFEFLEQVGKRASYSFKSDTPLIDAMIMFMQEFPIIDSAVSVEQLRMRLKDNELEQYGDAFIPEFVYDVIRKLPRFSSMRRGHQQDAEEFLGFLLEGLHDECAQVMQAAAGSNGTSTFVTPANVPSSPVSEVASLAGSVSGEVADGWLEVGPKQKAAVTRSSGTILHESPVTKIFGGTLRSELRVPGLKNSVTMEPYQPLQLDIGSPHVNNIIDALKGLTRPETLHGDFKSPRGANVAATKQYDNAGGTQKIWKKIGYPLELEIPKEVFSRQKQGSMLNHGGLPKYRLTAVVYHHGKNASGGHYTVDVRRQDGREWIRLDDTVIRRVRSEDVAEGGSEEDPKVLAAAAEAHKKDTVPSGNIFDQIKEEDDENNEGENGWKQVNGVSSSGGTAGKKWSNVANDAAGTKSKNSTFSMKDNKVAYLLFYQKMMV